MRSSSKYRDRDRDDKRSSPRGSRDSRDKDRRDDRSERDRYSGRDRNDDRSSRYRDDDRSRYRDDKDDDRSRHRDDKDDDKSRHRDDKDVDRSRHRDDKDDDKSRHRDDKDDDRSRHRDDKDDRRSKDDDRGRDRSRSRDDDRSRDRRDDRRDRHSRDDRYRSDRDRRRSRSRDRDRRRSRSPRRSRSRERPGRGGFQRRFDRGGRINKPGFDPKTATQTPQEGDSTQNKDRFFMPGITGRFRDQIEKRKMLWQKKDPEPEQAGPAVPIHNPKLQANAPRSTKLWEATTFAQDTDGKVANKFKRLMGIKTPSEGSNSTTEVLKKQDEMFNAMEQQYEVARTTTHTMRGVGLGFSSYNR
ncbi:U1 small nuclear ribonucleoprotein 70 kDa isoform X2 [Diabrotica virgifera virgifera]|nr:U1 small nuclear ribonucleoprotein 70 kDa isoform X2 [Diabrotica virgifera virgifera]XP_028130651.1 U1 small nuclear ribonucleoprotein 70 kDa isoform X2 [Diabrotica virgifera virgifera]